MNKLLIIFLVAISTFYPQKKDPDLILNKVKENFKRVEDYQVDVNIKVDIDFIKVPDMKAKLFFKQPDKMQFDSEGFAMLPKGGMNFSPSSLLSGKYTSFYERDSVENGIKVCVIKIIPLGDAGDVVLSTLWIDLENYRILKVESTTKTQGTFLIELKYPEGVEYPLPSAMIFSFNMEKMNLPQGISGDVDTKAKKETESKTTKGRVYITYTDYKINRGISDNVFKETKK